MKSLTPDTLLGRALNEFEKKNAPNQLYVEGPVHIPLSPRRVSIIGTRKPTEQGMREARTVTEMLVGLGVTIVSGLAAGIDAISHRTAIKMKGQTIAVIGTPLNKRYPQSNTGLQNEIAAKHLVVSQFPIGHPITKGNFVRRNKTMALISDATVIVEAGDGSGAIHQGWETLRLGRPLFVCRTAAKTRPIWLDEMKQYGATILEDPGDILYEIPHGTRLVNVFV